MKKFRTIGLFIILLITSNGMSQELYCDDFTDLVSFPTSTYGEEEFIGYYQGGTQTIETGAGTFAYVNNSDPGIYGVGPVNFEFDGTSQTARFLTYGFLGQFNEMGFGVNGSPIVYLDDVFPMTVGGVEVDLDLSPANVGSWEYFYLTFTGDIDVITHELFESGVIELCTTAEPVVELGCDDFTDLTNFPVNTFGAGDLIGYSQEGTQTIIAGVGAAFVWVNDSQPGIFGGGPVDFEFDGTSQTVRFLNYGAPDLFDGISFGVNGSPIVYLDGVFPMTVGGVAVDLDLSPADYDGLEYFYLTFTGDIDVITHVLFESGVIELCTTAEPVVELGCDDFTDLVSYPTSTYGEEEFIGYSQGGTETIETGAGAFAYVNNSDPGIYGVGPVNFEFDGTSQTARFLTYGFLGQFNEMGFGVNGSPIVYLDGVFPMTVGGVEVDLDLSPANVGSWEYFYLTFTGDIDVITHELFESGVTELCVEHLPVIDDAGLESVNTSSIAVYPNPATNCINIRAQSTISSVVVYSISGQELINETVGQNNIVLDLSELVSGLYLIKMTEQNGTESIEKLILE